MSAIWGVVDLEGRPVDQGLLERMSAALAHRGLDGEGLWTEGPVGLGHRILETTSESLNETEGPPGLYLVLDGRVDNLEQLGGATDAEAVLNAYAQWGEACPEHILGDYAFAIWDANTRRLFCARDFLGIRPFYYHFDGKRLLFASELRALLEDDSIRREPNEGMIGEIVANSITSVEETLYRGVLRLPPAHSLTLEHKRPRLSRYWNPEGIRVERGISDEEYAERFLDIFTDAVHVRLRSHAPVAADLSGGLDSSSVVVTARAMEATLDTFSIVFPGLPCDETRYIRAVASACGIPGHAVRAAPFDPEEETRRTLDLPSPPNCLAFAPLLTGPREQGCRVVLTGIGGDHLLSGTRSFLRSLRPRRRIPKWIDSDFARRIDLADRLRVGRRMPTRRQEEVYQTTTCGREVYGSETEDRLAAKIGVEQRHPFFDRRLVEFCLGLPESQRMRKGVEKQVLRRAMEDLLPEVVRLREDKAEFSHLFVDALRGFEPPAQWVNPDRVRTMALHVADHPWRIWFIHATSLWFRIAFP